MVGGLGDHTGTHSLTAQMPDVTPTYHREACYVHHEKTGESWKVRTAHIRDGSYFAERIE